MGGRPRTPTAILDARGAFKANPQRARAGEPIVREPVGQAPGDFNSGQRAAWNQIMSQCALGVLTEADTAAVELCACLLAEFRADRLVFPVSRIGPLITLLGRFGMTPSDRSRLSIPKAEKVENPYRALDK